MGLDGKRDAIGEIAADVLVIPECSRSSNLRNESGVSSHWHGDFAPTGLGVFAFGGWTVQPLREPDPLPWATAVQVRDPTGQCRLTLAAVWTARPGKRHGRPGYAAQVAAVIDRWAEGLAAGDVWLAGDFNCAAQGPSVQPHIANISRLEELRVHSAYHANRQVAHGDETEMTLRWIGPGRIPHLYHCDFVFVPGNLVPAIEFVEVGSIETWVESRRSDHVPVVVEVALAGMSTAN